MNAEITRPKMKFKHLQDWNPNDPINYDTSWEYLPEEELVYSMEKYGKSIFQRLNSSGWKLISDYNHKRLYTKKNWTLLLPDWVHIKPIFYRK